jgi:hypothetical protein
VPVPLSCTVNNGPPLPLLSIVNISARAPVSDGTNVTAIVQLAPGTRMMPQVVVGRKSPAWFASDPLTVIEKEINDELDELVNVTACAALDVPIACGPNSRLVGLTDCATATPIVNRQSAYQRIRIEQDLKSCSSGERETLSRFAL